MPSSFSAPFPTKESRRNSNKTVLRGAEQGQNSGKAVTPIRRNGRLWTKDSQAARACNDIRGRANALAGRIGPAIASDVMGLPESAALDLSMSRAPGPPLTVKQRQPASGIALMIRDHAGDTAEIKRVAQGGRGKGTARFDAKVWTRAGKMQAQVCSMTDNERTSL